MRAQLWAASGAWSTAARSFVRVPGAQQFAASLLADTLRALGGGLVPLHGRPSL